MADRSSFKGYDNSWKSQKPMEITIERRIEMRKRTMYMRICPSVFHSVPCERSGLFVYVRCRSSDLLNYCQNDKKKKKKKKVQVPAKIPAVAEKKNPSDII